MRVCLIVVLFGFVGMTAATAAPPEPETPPPANEQPKEKEKPKEKAPPASEHVVDKPERHDLPKVLRDQPEIDLLTDSALLSYSLGFAVLSELIIRTGEIRPQDPVNANKLLGLDRHFATTDGSRAAPGFVSDGGAAIAGTYALVSIFITGHDRGYRSGLVDAALFAESATFNWAVANLAKLAIRRPRPRAYLDQQDGVESSTDSALSFYSSHTAITAGIVTTAAYLAFVRKPDSSLGWWVTGIGTALVGAVAWGRVASREHFPTDVLAGAMAGAGIGLLVPHMHMPESERTFWVGVTPEGSGLTLGGIF